MLDNGSFYIDLFTVAWSQTLHNLLELTTDTPLDQPLMRCVAEMTSRLTVIPVESGKGMLLTRAANSYVGRIVQEKNDILIRLCNN
jgi:hypothetical protein